MSTLVAHLVKLLRRGKHFVHRLPALALIWARHRELFHLLELVHPEDSERVAPVRPGLLPEACRVSDVPLGQVLRLEPLLPMQRAERLL